MIRQRRSLSRDAFHALLREQGVPREHLAFVCAACGTVQSLALLQYYGCANPESMIGFSCVGRFAGAGSARQLGAIARLPSFVRAPKEQVGCDWTLGGLFRLHTLEVEMESGQMGPTFEVATPELAQQLQAALTQAGKSR